MALQLLDDATPITVADTALGVDGGDPDVSYQVRQILPQQAKAIAKRHTHARSNGERVDQVSMLEDLIDAAVVGWTGILVKGEPAPCTREHKLLLDAPRRLALLSVAGLNRPAAEVRDASFRVPA